MSRPKGSRNKPRFTQLQFDPIVTGSLETKTYILGQDEVINNNMEITHALRTINQGNFAEIERGMKEKFFDLGWRLFATHYIGNDPSAGIMILYVFIRGQ